MEAQEEELRLWNKDIQSNISMLAENITNLRGILHRLIQNNLISLDEYEIISSNEKTSLQKNWELLTTIKRKGWRRVKPTFMKILKETLNHYCVTIIERSSNDEQFSSQAYIARPLKSKWWPEKKSLPNSFYERKVHSFLKGSQLLIDKLKKILSKTKKGMTVINQNVAVSGLGGVGKSTTAKWYAREYEREYEFVIWIDCGEGSLLKSFTKLARDLDLKNRQELDLNELAMRSWELLEKNKCLLIFDNAECYVGLEGIRDVLPKHCEQFHSIITSRNREWGYENGDGRIPEFAMDVFTKDEGIDFMKKNLTDYSWGDRGNCKELCQLLGHLPLALQIATATLNQRKISLVEYIDQVKKFEYHLHKKFDDYEKTINKTMKISLDLIQNHEENVGGLAYKILVIFGYISPDDVVSMFFATVEKVNIAEISESANLLERYSLLTKSDTEKSITDVKLSIHRLLQQVIRHNTKKSQIQEINNILNCDGFLEYKLIPYSYADEETQKLFPEIRAEFIDRLEQNKLLKERRFQEAMELSRLIKDSMGSPASIFNFAMCLKYNADTAESMQVFENLLDMAYDKSDSYSSDYFNHHGLISVLTEDLTTEIVGGQMFILYSALRDEEKLKKLFLKSKRLIFPRQSLNEVVSCLDSVSFPKSYSYTLKFVGTEDLVLLSLEGQENLTKVFEFVSCTVNENLQLSQLPGDLHSLNLIDTKWLDQNIIGVVKNLNLIRSDFIFKTYLTASEVKVENSSVDINVLPQGIQKLELEKCDLVNFSPISENCERWRFPESLEELKIMYINSVKDSNGVEIETIDISKHLPPNLSKFYIWDYSDRFCVSVDALVDIQCIQLKSCRLVLAYTNRMTPAELTFANVKVVDENHKNISNILVNTFLDFRQMKKLELCGIDEISIDMSEPLTIDEVSLNQVEIVNWKGAKWNIGKFELESVDFVEETKIVAREMIVKDSEVDIFYLSRNLEILDLTNCTLINLSEDIRFPLELKRLKLSEILLEDDLDDLDVSQCFPSCLNELTVECSFNSTQLAISCQHLKSIQILHLDNCSLISQLGNCIQPKQLTLYNVQVVDQNGVVDPDFYVNDFVDFSKMQKLKMSGLSLDFSVSLTIKDVWLENTKVVNWKNGKWAVQNFCIWPDPGPTIMSIKQLQIQKLEYGLVTNIDQL